MKQPCTNGRTIELFNYYIKEKMNHYILINIYNRRHNSIIKYIIKDLPIDCIN